MAPWTPNLLPGLAVHLDASALGLADGTSVLPWPNGSAPNPVQYKSPPPVMRTNVLNSKSVVHFTALEGVLRWNGNTGVDAPFTLAYVGRVTDLRVNPSRVVSGIYPPMNILFGFYGVQADILYAGYFSGTPVTTVANQWKMYSADSNAAGGSIGFWVEGAPLPGAGGGGQTLNNELALGGYDPTGNDGQCPDFDIAELILYNSELADADRQKVEGYLAHKWGRQASLPADHPYKSSAPVAVASDGWDDAVGPWSSDDPPWDSYSVAVNVTGLELTVSTGTVAAGGYVGAIPNGNEVAVQLGSAAVRTQQKLPVFGQELSVQLGSVAVRTQQKITVTGQQLTVQLGNEAANGVVNVFPVGQELTVQLGNESVAYGTKAFVTGQELSVELGNELVSTQQKISAIGHELTASVGTVSVRGKANVTVEGQEVTTELGSVELGIGVNISVTGEELTLQLGEELAYGIVNVFVEGHELTVGIGVPSFKYDYRFGVTGLEMKVEQGEGYGQDSWSWRDTDPLPEEKWAQVRADDAQDWVPVGPPYKEWHPVQTGEKIWTDTSTPDGTWKRWNEVEVRHGQ